MACKNLPWTFMYATICNMHDIKECVKKGLESSNQVNIFMKKKMAQISILDNHLTMEFVKHKRKENKRNQSIGQFSPFLLCLRYNVYVFYTIYKCPPPRTHTCGGAIFHVNKRATYVGSWFHINCLTTWTTSFCSCRLAFKKTLRCKSFKVYQNLVTMSPFLT